MYQLVPRERQKKNVEKNVKKEKIKVVEIYAELKQFGLEVDLWDPWASQAEVKHEYGIDIISNIPEDKTYDVILLAVAHNEFLSLDFNKIKNENTVIFDAKAILNRDIVDSRL